MYADAGTVHARADAGGPRCAATAPRFRCSRARGSSDRCGWRASGGDDLATSRLEIRFFGAASKGTVLRNVSCVVTWCSERWLVIGGSLLKADELADLRARV